MKACTMSLDPDVFKQAMSRWASGVTVVTTRTEDGQNKGITASSFISVSLEPMLVLVSVAKKLYTHELMQQTDNFAVNVLGTQHVEWGKLFAGMYPEVEDRFAHTGYTTAVTGAPILPTVLAWLDCKTYQIHDAGDHSLFIGQVVAADGNGEGEPLLYSQRKWGQFTQL